MDKEDIIDEKIRAEYPPHCDACGRQIELYEEIYDFMGKICKECYEDVKKNQK